MRLGDKGFLGIVISNDMLEHFWMKSNFSCRYFFSYNNNARRTKYA